MKKIFYILLSFFLVIAFSVDANAQLGKGSSTDAYSSAIGLRFTDGTGITYKTAIGDNGNYLELIPAFRSFDFDALFIGVTGLYEMHNDIESVDNLRWFWGPGATVGLSSTKVVDGRDNSISLGLNGIVGLDYTFANIPLNLTLDYLPSIDLSLKETDVSFHGTGFALSARYILE